ncbi:MAG: hypothetical protein U0800_14670 [Isosphaeraceae bacterium]
MTVPRDESTVATVDTPPPKVSRQGQGGGPKTAFGKAASSKNATTHGLAAKQARTLPDYFQNDVHERMFYYVAHHQPQCDDDNALCGLAAIGFVQHRNALSEQFQYLRVRSRRAQTCWSLDRSVDAGLLAQKLPKRPGVVSLQLAGTYHGAIWLLDRWHHLARSLEGTGLWSEEEIQLAYDLLGRDAMSRQHDPDRVVAGTLEERKALVSKRIARLQELVDGPLKELDAEQRLQAIRGQGYLDDPVYRRFDRYGNRALKLNRDCLAELERRRTGLDGNNPGRHDRHAAAEAGRPGGRNGSRLSAAVLPSSRGRTAGERAGSGEAAADPQRAEGGNAGPRADPQRAGRAEAPAERGGDPEGPAEAGRGSQGPGPREGPPPGRTQGGEGRPQAEPLRPERAGSIETEDPGVRRP